MDSINNNSGGTIIFINKKFDYRIIDCSSVLNDSNACDVVGICLDKIDLDIIIVYRRPYGITPKKIWNKIGKLSSSRKNTIITGDLIPITQCGIVSTSMLTEKIYSKQCTIIISSV